MIVEDWKVRKGRRWKGNNGLVWREKECVTIMKMKIGNKRRYRRYRFVSKKEREIKILIVIGRNHGHDNEGMRNRQLINSHLQIDVGLPRFLVDIRGISARTDPFRDEMPVDPWRCAR